MAQRNEDSCSSLSGKVVVVTGASSGIGAAIAKYLAKHGASVALGARRIAKLDEIVSEIRKEGGQAIAVKTDVTKRQEVKDLVAVAESEFGPVDIMVNNAGIMYFSYMKNLYEDEWEQQVDVNCKGVLHGIGAVLPGMLERGKGHIVNMSSDAGKVSFEGLAVYSGTKFFIEGVTAALRRELSKTGIKVTIIQPGDVKSEILNYGKDEEARKSLTPEDDSMFLEGDDIAKAVHWAVSQPHNVGVNEILIEPRTIPYT